MVEIFIIDCLESVEKQNLESFGHNAMFCQQSLSLSSLFLAILLNFKINLVVIPIICKIIIFYKNSNPNIL